VSTLFFSVVWLVPVATRFVPSSKTAPGQGKWPWAWLGNNIRPQAIQSADGLVAPETRINLQRVLLPGFGVAIVYSVVLIAVRLIFRATVSEAIRDSDQFKIALFQTSLSIGALLQVLVAGVVAARQTQLGAELAIFSAFVSTTLMLLGHVVVNVLFGGLFSLAFIESSFPLLVNVGCLFALIGGLIGSKAKARRGDRALPLSSVSAPTETSA
jgi:hypothetical protein